MEWANSVKVHTVQKFFFTKVGEKVGVQELVQKVKKYNSLFCPQKVFRFITKACNRVFER